MEVVELWGVSRLRGVSRLWGVAASRHDERRAGACSNYPSKGASYSKERTVYDLNLVLLLTIRSRYLSMYQRILSTSTTSRYYILYYNAQNIPVPYCTKFSTKFSMIGIPGTRVPGYRRQTAQITAVVELAAI